MATRTLTMAAFCAAGLSVAVATAAAAAPAATTPDPVGVHSAIAQAQERLAEMDATVTVLQQDADKLDGAARDKAREAVQSLRTIRETYKKEIDGIVAQGRQLTADQLSVAKAALAAPWTQFDQAVDREVAAAKLDVAQRKALVEARIKAEQAYWQSVIADLQASAASLTAEQRAAIDDRIARVKVRLDETQSRLTRLGHATQSAWSTLKAGLASTRKNFEDAYSGGR